MIVVLVYLSGISEGSTQRGSIARRCSGIAEVRVMLSHQLSLVNYMPRTFDGLYAMVLLFESKTHRNGPVA
jgi:hypothetical protein